MTTAIAKFLTRASVFFAIFANVDVDVVPLPTFLFWQRPTLCALPTHDTTR
jgi:hypothetical protein